MNATTLTFEQKLAKAELQARQDHEYVRMQFIRRANKVRTETTYLMRNRYERAKELFAAKNGK